jgi:hypothetical protein
MIPRSISASALQVAEKCLARYKAQQIDRIPQIQNESAATLGTTVHWALEMYVNLVYIDKKEAPDLDLLEMLYQSATKKFFVDISQDVYDDGWQMLVRWHGRTSFEGVEVLSTESKEFFTITTSSGLELPVNYIFDRLDYLGDGVYRVVDYKSQRWALNLEELRNKIQAQVYSFAARMKFPEAKEIWIELDFLRHDVVGTRFSLTEDRANFIAMLDAVDKIIDAPDDPTPTLNSECMFCPIKVTCEVLHKHIDIGGILSLSFDELVDLRADMDYQRKGLAAAQDEVDRIIMASARAAEIMEHKTGKTKLSFTVRKVRTVDPTMVEKTVGPETFELYGGKSITMEKFKKLLADPTINPATKKALEDLVTMSYSDPRIKVEASDLTDD